jgi:hypothetical protein
LPTDHLALFLSALKLATLPAEAPVIAFLRFATAAITISGIELAETLI